MRVRKRGAQYLQTLRPSALYLALLPKNTWLHIAYDHTSAVLLILQDVGDGLYFREGFGFLALRVRFRSIILGAALKRPSWRLMQE